MSPSQVETPLPTEPLLGPWSLTAFALVLVLGGILGLLASFGSDGSADRQAADLHATDHPRSGQ